MDKIVHDDRLVQALAQFNQGLDAGSRFLGAGFQQREELVFFAKDSLE
jgi:hypothetical protein